MKIIKAFPPNYADIIAAIPAVKKRSGIIFTYGDTVYCPHSSTLLPAHLVKHEQTHIDQQAQMGVSVWWARYLRDPEFRLQQETEAYRAQYAELRSTLGRKERRLILSNILNDLSGPMYGGLIDNKTAKVLVTGAYDD